MNDEFEAFLQKIGIQHLITAVHNPQTNGKVEVFDRYPKHEIEAKTESESFEESLVNLLVTYRSMPSDPHKDSPAKRFLGREVRLSFELPRLLRFTDDGEDQVAGDPQLHSRDHFINRSRHDEVLKKKPRYRKGNTTYILSRSKALTTLSLVSKLIRESQAKPNWRKSLSRSRLTQDMLDLINEAAAKKHSDFPDHRLLRDASTSFIKKEIMERGPLATCFDITEDFQVYERGIYHSVTGGKMYGHCVRLIGWGRENNVSYWLLSNTWGPEWGENGFFRIKEDELPDTFSEDIFGLWPDP